jgi:hypothetical protein
MRWLDAMDSFGKSPLARTGCRLQRSLVIPLLALVRGTRLAIVSTYPWGITIGLNRPYQYTGSRPLAPVPSLTRTLIAISTNHAHNRPQSHEPAEAASRLPTFGWCVCLLVSFRPAQQGDLRGRAPLANRTPAGSHPTVAHLSKEVLPLGALLAPRVASGFASFADADVTALDGPCDRARALDPSIAAAVGQAEKSAVCGALGRQAVSQP